MTKSVIKGEVWTFGRDINTDYVSAGRYSHIRDMKEKVTHIFEDVDPRFAKEFKSGGVIVAGENFGCGSSREIAPVLIKFAGVAAVLAPSFARIFFRNSLNIGLPILEIPGVDKLFEKGNQVEIDLKTGRVLNVTTGRVMQAPVFPPFIQSIVDMGGLVEYASRKLEGKIGV
jgi:3-isopropylmalate/(R)-2-methylmalate dehydratase small subunit